MKRVLLPIETDRYPQELLDFVAVLAPLTPIQLTAVFSEVSAYGVPARAGVAADGNFDEEGSARLVRCHSRILTRFCEEKSIQVKVHVDNNDLALPSLEQESRFCDLLLLSATKFFQSSQVTQPNAWIKHILHKSECAVLVVPDKAGLPAEILLAYDGSAASVYAIRQFHYLFPEFKGIQVTLVYVHEQAGASVPDEQEIREWCSMHFNHFRVENLQAKGDAFYNSWIRSRKNAWLVAGSYSQGGLAAVLAKSFSHQLIRDHQLAVFIAHR